MKNFLHPSEYDTQLVRAEYTAELGMSSTGFAGWRRSRAPTMLQLD